MSTISLFDQRDMRSVSVTTNFSSQGPCSISFECSRTYPQGVDMSINYLRPDIFHIFKKAVEGKAHEDMEPNDCAACIGADMSHCGNRRGYLAECRCEDLNRKIKPYIRNHFETKVIDKILTHVKIEQTLRTGAPFQFNLAIFCSGRLLGEEILLFRLLNRLHQHKASGIINLFLIDKNEYAPAISLGKPELSLDRHKYLHQFLAEICGCLPPSLKINGTIFAEADDYTAQAQVDARFRHDLLIGADIEGTQKIMSEISSKASSTRGQTPFALVRSVKTGGPPGSCDIVCGQLTDCSLYVDSPQHGQNIQPPKMKAPVDLQQSSSNTQSFPWELPVVAAVAAIAVAVIFSFKLSSR